MAVRAPLLTGLLLTGAALAWAPTTIGSSESPARETARAAPGDNARAFGEADIDAILPEAVSVANGDFFAEFLPIVREEVRELIDLQKPATPVASDHYSRVDDSRAEPTAGGIGGIHGGRYACLAGGEAIAPAIFGGPSGTGFLVRFEQCVTRSDALGATVTLDGEALVLPGGRDGGERYRYARLTIRSARQRLAIDGERVVDIVGRGGSSVGDVETTVSDYTRETDDGEIVRVRSYRSRLVVEVLPYGGVENTVRTAGADFAFVVSAASIGGRTLTVRGNLAYDASGRAVEPGGDQWDSGRIVVVATDGRRITAEPIATDPTTALIRSGDLAIERRWADGYQIRCVGNLSGCR